MSLFGPPNRPSESTQGANRRGGRIRSCLVPPSDDKENLPAGERRRLVPVRSRVATASGQSLAGAIRLTAGRRIFLASACFVVLKYRRDPYISGGNCGRFTADRLPNCGFVCPSPLRPTTFPIFER